MLTPTSTGGDPAGRQAGLVAPTRGRWSRVFGRPPADPRYRVLQRRDVREAVRLELVLEISLVVSGMACFGIDHPVTDVVALVILAIEAFLFLNRRIVQRLPHATAVFTAMLLDVLVAVALVDAPGKSILVIGAFGVLIVGSALFVTFDTKLHLFWLAVAVGIWLVAVLFARMGNEGRFEALIVCLAAVATSAAGNWLVSNRRWRAYETEATLRRERRELRETVARLEAARATIATLEGVLPICAHCKRIRESDNTWVRIERYVEQRSAAHFSHGICPECADRYFPGVLEES
jgi:hypothetical protein